MKKRKGMSIGQKLGHFFRHYFVILLLAMLCAVVTVLMIGFVS